MKNRFSSLVKTFATKPKKIFIVDSLGALLSAFIIIAMLLRYTDVFGMPKNSLFCLSIIAVIYATYSLCCYFFLDQNWRPYLKFIAFANLLYCCLTITFVTCSYASITTFGLIYFSVELIVIVCLATVEFMIASHLSAKK